MNDTTDRIDPETALVEFDRFLDAMDIDGDVTAMNEKDAEGFEQQKRVVVRAIQQGHLVINDEGEPVYTLKAPAGDLTTVRFREPQGASYMAADKAKKGADVSKMYAIMGEMVGQHPGVFAKMKQRDLKVCQALAVLFLG